MTAGAALLVQSGEERVLTLATLHDLRRATMIQIGAFMPDACERVIAALTNGPHDYAHRFVRARDVYSRVMQSFARHEKEGAKRAIRLLRDTDGIAKRSASEQRKVRIRGPASLAPVVLNVVARIERKLVRRARRHIRGETVCSASLAFDEVPKGHAAVCACDGGNAIGVGFGGLEGDCEGVQECDVFHAGGYYLCIL